MIGSGISNFVHIDSLSMSEISRYQLKAWLECETLEDNAIVENDTLSFEIQVVNELPKKRVLVEHHSGTYCCPCVNSVAFSTFIEDEINLPQECGDEPYYHPDVAREMFGGIWGWDNVIPQHVQAGDEFTKQVQYIIPKENHARKVNP